MRRFICFQLVIGLVVVAALPATAETPAHLWSNGYGGTNLDEIRGATVDAAGNVILTGRFGATVDFGGGALVSAGNDDIFLVKYDASGAHLWSKRFGSTGFDTGYAVELDAVGNVWVTGQFQGTVDFGGGGLVAGGNADVFLAKFDAGGNHLLSQRYGGIFLDRGTCIAVDTSDNVFLGGIFA